MATLVAPFGAEGDRQSQLLAYQHLQMLPLIAEGASNKLRLIPTELSCALARFEAEFPHPTQTAGSPRRS